MQCPPVFAEPSIDSQSVIEAEQRQSREERRADEESFSCHSDLSYGMNLIEWNIPDVSAIVSIALVPTVGKMRSYLSQ